MPDFIPLRFHEDADFFKEAVSYTAAQTAFSPHFIEKDYFCTALLAYLFHAPGEWIFKGGTCLAKVHAGFYRLSEDLDFSISVDVDSPKSVRNNCMKPFKQAMTDLPRHLSGFHVVNPLRGANNSTQYLACVTYTSLLTGNPEPIKLEVSLREPLLEPAFSVPAQTVLQNPLRGVPLVPSLAIPCISRREAYAEKFRAALSRREVAIRDFYDLDYAARNNLFTLDDELIALVRAKLAIAGNDSVNVSPQRRAELDRQLEAQLRPVLRDTDFQAFDLERAFQLAVLLAKRLS